MKALVIREWGKPLRMESVERPKPKPGEVLVKLNVTGICHTDIHQWRGDWPYVKQVMESLKVNILGHEGVGVVEEIGEGVTLLKKGQRVGIPWMNYWCGSCDMCLSGNPHWCRRASYTSVTVNGTYAEYATVSERAAVPIPEAISDEEAAPLLCGGVTAYGAVRKLVTEARIPSGKTIAVIGAAGGLGHYGVQIAKAFGYRVMGVDIGKSRVEFVKNLGADYAVEPDEAVELSNKVPISAAIVFTPRISGYNLAARIVGTLGTIVVVGVPDEQEGPINITPINIVLKGVKIIPSMVGVTHEFSELFDLYISGKVKSVVSRRGKLEEVNEIYNELLNLKYFSRAVVSI
jgi:propanol-preferring alcohol dehydrogenase